MAELIASRTRAQWEQVFAGCDACVEPVLSPGEAAADAHAVARGLVETAQDVSWCRAPLGLAVSGEPPAAGQHSSAVLTEIGYSDEEIVRFRERGVVG